MTAPLEKLDNTQPSSKESTDNPLAKRRQPLSQLFDWSGFRQRFEGNVGEESWWFASTAIPLLAATIGPLANVLSIAALVVSWRMNRLPGGHDACILYNGNPASLVPEIEGFSFPDPGWCYHLNIVSLVAGFVGNLFLLANFTNRIRYIIALPVTIVLWYLATGILTGITIAMAVYTPPVGPCQTYTQGFWYAVIAAVLYFTCSMILMINMLGYFLGQYPQHFNLTEAQRTLILQTMVFFVWLAGGAGIFARVETDLGDQKWLFTDALYFCDVTILTVGFGDLTPSDDTGRGLVLPYSVGGIISLGLVVSSLTTFVGSLGKEKIIQRHLEFRRQRTLERSNTSELRAREETLKSFPHRPEISHPINGRRMSTPMTKKSRAHTDSNRATSIRIAGVQTPLHLHRHKERQRQRDRLHILREEKDRFEAMRHIQRKAGSFKSYTALISSTFTFCVLWLVGAAVFHATEANTLGMTYFQALYFCYVSLLTIGYGDLAPKSNAGRPFFVVWSLLAVPSVTILVSHLGSTIIASFNRATNAVADFTVLPRRGVWRNLLEKSPWLLNKLQSRAERKAKAKRLEEGFRIGPEADATDVPAGDGVGAYRVPSTLEQLAAEENESAAEREARLSKKLAATISHVSLDIKGGVDRRYSYEEWVEITELIRFTTRRRLKRERGIEGVMLDNDDEDEDGLIEWDWIGEDSPMMAGKSEPEFVMERLCESLCRYMSALEGMGVPASPVSVRGTRLGLIDRGEASGCS